MKNNILIALTILVLLLGGCSQSGASSTDSHSNMLSSTPSSQVKTIGTPESNENFDLYQITDDNPTFSSIISQNEIDGDYQKELYEKATTTNEFVDVENKFLNIWKVELKNAIDKYTKMLSSSDKAKFLQLEKQWEESTIDNLDFENKVLNGNEYGVELGSSSNYLFISQKREAYRQRTIRVKYLHYLLETTVSNPKSINDCISLKFVYNEQS